MALATIEDFQKIEIRLGRIIRVEDFPNAKKPAYKLWIDFGPIGIKQSSAQITSLYSKETLQNTFVLAVTNFPPRKVADFVSEVLVLGVHNAQGEVVLIRPEFDAPLAVKLKFTSL
jgi:tRNA-binding protein